MYVIFNKFIKFYYLIEYINDYYMESMNGTISNHLYINLSDNGHGINGTTQG